MMRAVTCIIFLVSFCCCSNKDSVPAKYIQPKQMQLVVWDVMQADELAMLNKINDSTLVLKNESFRLYDKVFAIHKTSRSEFYKSYKYYQEHPTLYKELMDGVKRVADRQKKSAKNTP